MAAGLGFKTFTTGEVLTSADVNGYLMQGVLVFASAAARNAAITSPQEGQFAFTKDTNGLWYYDGAAWVASGATGDIEGVTAGVGISGGGTSGTVTVTNDMATTITAAGDIVVGTGSGTYDNLPIGTTNQILTADTTVSPYKVKWATPAGGGGKVLQVVNVVYSTSAANNTSTYADTGLTASITPTLASSKVLVIVNQSSLTKSTGNLESGVGLKLMRDSTDIITFAISEGYTGTSGLNNFGSCATTYLDSPATTSSTTYKTQFKNTYYNGNGVSCQTNGGSSTITLLEIGA
jgi:hypothetical protein